MAKDDSVVEGKILSKTHIAHPRYLQRSVFGGKVFCLLLQCSGCCKRVICHRSLQSLGVPFGFFEFFTALSGEFAECNACVFDSPVCDNLIDGVVIIE